MHGTKGDRVYCLADKSLVTSVPHLHNKQNESLPIHIFQELCEIEELWCKFLYVIWIIHQQFPCLRNGVELPVSNIKPVHKTQA